MEEEDEGLDRLTWDILSWDLIQGTPNTSRDYIDLYRGNELHTIHEENGSGNFVVLGITSDSDMGISKFTFKRPVGSSYTAIQYLKKRPDNGYDIESSSSVAPLDENGEFFVEVSEPDCPWCYIITFGHVTSENNFVADTCTYPFYFGIDRLMRISGESISWSSDDNTVFDAYLDYPECSEFNNDYNYFNIYVNKDTAPSSATANLIIGSPFDVNDHSIYASYWKQAPGDHIGDTLIESIVQVNNGSVSIPVSGADGSMIYNIQFGILDNNEDFQPLTYTYSYQTFWKTQMSWDNIKYKIEGGTLLSENKSPTTSDDTLFPYTDMYNSNILNLPVLKTDDSECTMTITINCPQHLQKVDGLTVEYIINGEYHENTLTDDSIEMPKILFLINPPICGFILS